jgi:hypothetical protein
VRSLTSNFDMTTSGLKITKPAPLKPPLTLSLVTVVKCATLNARRNLALVMWCVGEGNDIDFLAESFELIRQISDFHVLRVVAYGKCSFYDLECAYRSV